MRKPAQSSGASTGYIIAAVAGIGLFVLLPLIGVTMYWLSRSSRPTSKAEVASNPPLSIRDAASPPGPPEASQPPGPPGPPAPPDPPSPPAPTGPTEVIGAASSVAGESDAPVAGTVPPTTALNVPPVTASFAGLEGTGELAPGLQDWFKAGKAPFKGVHRVGEGDNLQAHYSWLVQVLPYIGHQKTYESFDFQRPLLDRQNIEVGGQIIPEFQNPGDPRKRWQGYPFENMALTHFVGMAGIEDSRNVVAARLPRSDPRAGIFGYDEAARAAEVTDGLSQTILVIGGGELASPWVMGGGATVRGAREPYFDAISGFGSRGRPSSGAIVVMADGSVRHVAADVDPQVFRSMCTIHGGEQFDLTAAASPTAIDLGR